MNATGQRRSLSAVDGVELAFYTYGPPEAERAAVVLHGIESHSGWFTASSEALAEAGLRVVALDRRGSGGSGGLRGHASSTVVLLDDLRRLIEWTRSERPGRLVQAVAHSWGAVYALAYQGRSPATFERLSLIGPGLYPRVDLTLAQKLQATLGALSSPEMTFPIPIEGPASFTANPAKREAIASDEARLLEATARFYACAWLLRLRAISAARRSRAPLAVYLGERDAIIDTEASRRFFYGCGEGVVVETFKDAHHTLEFEAEPGPFLETLVKRCTAPRGGETLT